jgi:hypothetical protein
MTRSWLTVIGIGIAVVVLLLWMVMDDEGERR